MKQLPTSRARASGFRVHYAYAIVLLGLLCMLGAQGFTRFSYSMLLPGVRDALQLNYAQMGLLATANFVGFTLTSPFVGWMVVRFGYRRTIGFSTATVGVAVFLTGAIQSFELALWLQFIAGCATGLVVVTTMSLPKAWVGPRHRGMAAGVISAGGPLGAVITGPLLPYFFVTFGAMGWRYGWFALGATVVVIGLLGLAFLRNHPSDKGLAPLGAQGETAPPPKGQHANWSLLYRSPAVWHLCLLQTGSTLGAISFGTFFAAYLMKEHSVDAATAGQLWALSGAIGIFSGFIWGGISDRTERRLVMAATFGLQAICFALFAAGSSMMVFALCALVYGFTARGVLTISAALFADGLDDHLAAAAFGLSSLFAGIGQAVGPYIAGFIADSTSSFALAFWFSASVALVSAFGSAVLPRKLLKDEPAESR